jgi:hypothetical protein
MERTLLYYPTIELPREEWLKQALLYTDKVSSILPFKEHDRLPETVKYLDCKEQYTPVYIEDIIQENADKYKLFENDFLSQIEDYRIINASSAPRRRSRFNGIFREKMTTHMIYMLERKGLVSNQTQEQIFLDENIAIYYMAGLARFASASLSDQFIIPSTDYKRFSNLSFDSFAKTEKAYNLIFKNCLPVPDSNVEISDIIDFKKSHSNELKRFRQFVKDLIREINSANDDYEIKEYIKSATEKIELEISTLSNALKKNKIKTIFSSLNTLLGVENPKTFETLFNVGLVSTPINPKVGLGIASVGIIGRYINNKFFSDSKINEFDYLFQAKKMRIIK